MYNNTKMNRHIYICTHVSYKGTSASIWIVMPPTQVNFKITSGRLSKPFGWIDTDPHPMTMRGIAKEPNHPWGFAHDDLESPGERVPFSMEEIIPKIGLYILEQGRLLRFWHPGLYYTCLFSIQISVQYFGCSTAWVRIEYTGTGVSSNHHQFPFSKSDKIGAMLEAGEATKNMPKTRAWRSNQKIWKVKKTWTCAIFSTGSTPSSGFINSNSTHTLQASIFPNMFDQSCLSDHTW